MSKKVKPLTRFAIERGGNFSLKHQLWRNGQLQPAACSPWQVSTRTVLTLDLIILGTYGTKDWPRDEKTQTARVWLS
jgi:hypothetical protein